MPEGNVAHNFVHDLLDGRRDLRARRVAADGEIAAAISKPTPEREICFGSNHAADRLRVTFVTIGTENAAARRPRRRTSRFV